MFVYLGSRTLCWGSLDECNEFSPRYLTVSRTVSSAAQDDRVFKHLSLRPQAMNPLFTHERYHQLMERCIRSEQSQQLDFHF
ncbi:hypothetical protein Bca4012_091449 [Brassica carinata]